MTATREHLLRLLVPIEKTPIVDVISVLVAFDQHKPAYRFRTEVHITPRAPTHFSTHKCSSSLRASGGEWVEGEKPALSPLGVGNLSLHSTGTDLIINGPGRVVVEGTIPRYGDPPWKLDLRIELSSALRDYPLVLTFNGLERVVTGLETNWRPPMSTVP